MNSLKSHAIYHRRKRRGILLFAILIVGCAAFMMRYESEDTVVVSEDEQAKVLAFQQEIDSLKSIEIERRKPKIYPFNPTLLTDYNGYKLGMTSEEIDRVVRFRESGKWFTSAKEFQNVSKVSDSLLVTIAPYFKWPKWMTDKKKGTTSKYPPKKKWKTLEEKSELNTVTYEELLTIEGVDENAATKIIQYREKIGGFVVDFQIHSVYGVSKGVKRLILNNYAVKQELVTQKVAVNTATASDLSTVPLLNYDLAKEIVDYRMLHEGINSLKELKDLEGMTDFKYDIIKLYLHIN